jgi:opacity protein-like surface antigen
MKSTIMAALVATVFGISAANAEGLYVGVGGDYVQSTARGADETAAASVRVGNDFSKYMAAELDVNVAMANGNQRSNTTTTANVLVGYPVNLGVHQVKPYALVGTGYDFAYEKHSDNIHTNPIYNYGAGVQVNMTKNMDLDARYTRVEEYNGREAANVFGIGIDYHF